MILWHRFLAVLKGCRVPGFPWNLYRSLFLWSQVFLYLNFRMSLKNQCLLKGTTAGMAYLHPLRLMRFRLVQEYRLMFRFLLMVLDQQVLMFLAPLR